MAETLTEASPATIAGGKAFIWHELYVGDGEAGRDFYVNALGWDKEDMNMGGDMGTYHMLKAFGSAVAGVMGTNNRPDMKDVPPHWAIYIAVENVDARVDKCTELGGKVIVPAFDVPTIGRMALLQDPQGAHFWLFKGDM